MSDKLARGTGIGTLLIMVCCMGYLSTFSARVWAEPGDILELELVRRYSPGEIHGLIQPLFAGYEMPSLDHAVDLYRAVFESRYPDGETARVFAQVVIPVFEGPAETRALYVFGPGSTGLIDNCRPSREHEAGIRWGLYLAHVLSHAGKGVIGIIPDYLGFGDPDREQYYMVAKAEAAALLDAVRSFNQIQEHLALEGISGTRNFLAGFSQGGHAVFAAADFRNSYAPELELSGVIGYGPSTDITSLLLEYPSVAPMIIYTYSKLYGQNRVDPALIFSEPYASGLEEDVLSQCVGGMQAYYPNEPQELYHPDFYKALVEEALPKRYPDLATILQKNSTGITSHGIDTLILQGTEDIVVFPETQQSFVDTIRFRGDTVELKIFEGARHDTRQSGFDLVQNWMNQRL
jgi:acetyl esterase/lipase